MLLDVVVCICVVVKVGKVGDGGYEEVVISGWVVMSGWVVIETVIVVVVVLVEVLLDVVVCICVPVKVGEGW